MPAAVLSVEHSQRGTRLAVEFTGSARHLCQEIASVERRAAGEICATHAAAEASAVGGAKPSGKL